MVDLPTMTQAPLTRNDIARFIPTPRGVEAFERLQQNSDQYSIVITDLTDSVNAILAAPILSYASSTILDDERVLGGSANVTVTLGASAATLDLTDTAVSPATYGSASLLAQFSVDAKGRITDAAEFTLDSDNVTEGSVNLFFTDARARAAISGGAGLAYNSGTGVMDVGAGSGITVNANDVALDTSSSRNVDHSAVSVIAGAGLTGGGTIASDRTLDIGAGTGITVNANDVALTVPTASGTYTPTLTNVTNLSASTAYSCQYLMVGSVVTVSGQVDIDAIAVGSVELGITLPIASNLANSNECAGTAVSDQVAGMAGAILADAANNRARLLFVTTDTSARGMFFSFTYSILV